MLKGIAVVLTLLGALAAILAFGAWRARALQPSYVAWRADAEALGLEIDGIPSFRGVDQFFTELELRGRHRGRAVAVRVMRAQWPESWRPPFWYAWADVRLRGGRALDGAESRRILAEARRRLGLASARVVDGELRVVRRGRHDRDGELRDLVEAVAEVAKRLEATRRAAAGE